MKVKALLFDTRSIQRYIFSGNRLRTNIGASYLVERVFDDVLVGEILMGTEEAPGLFYGEVDNESRVLEDEADWTTLAKKCRVAYIGGGNALILFRSDTEEGIEQKVIRMFSESLLISHPGLRIGAAFALIDTEPEETFQQGMDNLYRRLKDNQNQVFPLVTVPYTGLTLSCEVNGEAANFLDTEGLVKKRDKEPRFFSQEVRCKAAAAEEASDKLRQRFEELLSGAVAAFGDYEFPLALDELGQRHNETRENYIAIVHVDGNNMGEKFRRFGDTMERRRRLAMDVRRKTEVSFAMLLERIIGDCEAGKYEEILDLSRRGKKVLPVRPLILGGDDVTFICPAKMAVMFTKWLMEILLEDVPEKYGKIASEAARQMDSCAGIAILPTSYPFFRGYQLAEQLCGAAKKKMRSQSSPNPQRSDATMECPRSSWLDFAILHGEQAPSLEQIRAQEYTGARGDMHFGPYQVGNKEGRRAKEQRYNIENLLECVRGFHKGTKDKLPRNKIKELRSVLQGEQYEADKFLSQLARLGQGLPKVAAWDIYARPENAFWSGTEHPVTPYVDAIEMMDFIPAEILKRYAEEGQK